MKLAEFMIVCFGLIVFAGSAFGQTPEGSVSELHRVANVLEKSATVLGYEAVRGYLSADEWETDEKESPD